MTARAPRFASFITRSLAITSAAPLLLAGCGDSESPQDGSPDAAVATERTLKLSFTGLEPLGAGHVYEGWAIVNGAPVSTGRFTLDAQGHTTPASFMVDRAMADAATLFVLTIEPATGDDPAPAKTHVMAGPFANKVASLSMDHEAALGTSFADAAGSYLLATPSTAGNSADNNQGIWFLTPGEPPNPGLTLPTLPEGWVYEGWVADASGPVSTGRFKDPSKVDSDGAGPTAGPDGGPALPGQDFINPALVLNGGNVAAVISVEPEPDDSAAPFAIKPLIANPIGAATAPTVHTMTNQAATTALTGMAKFE